MRYENIDNEELEAKDLAETLVREYPPRILDHLLILLEKLLRRQAIEEMLSEDKGVID